MVDYVALIIGLVLVFGIFNAVSIISDLIDTRKRWFGAFQTAVGFITIILAYMDPTSLRGVMFMVSGFVLMAGFLPHVPKKSKFLEENLDKVVPFIGVFQAIIGLSLVAFALGWL